MLFWGDGGRGKVERGRAGVRVGVVRGGRRDGVRGDMLLLLLGCRRTW